ncbi:hypothetical protein EJ05DRAFT_317836 [Pseudovirgaria hyperparasitica]|uniref:Uncharacterized protein n=1 Tax=Pseudovirgaria hyperparasitica TaxID=470096 RepID=A0A6A6WBN5_9PEZI|nr:uncharacterized protein EJ05DRAFT_317836 [Pseudovirgaria hyperparasitica]KAF2759985.1 hypothetical protein EJ05DRAFT_317836 [Pseudovirgaria hyperparasitica]
MNESDPKTSHPLPTQPTSPPATPSSKTQPRFPSATSHPPTRYAGLFTYSAFSQSQSPPLEHIEPIGQGHHFNYTRPQAQNTSARRSSVSSFAQASSPEPSDAGTQNSGLGIQKPLDRKASQDQLIIEELADTTSSFASDVEIVRPDNTEEVTSDHGHDDRDILLGGFRRMNCGTDDENVSGEQARRYRRKKKRWSAGYYKRTHSQSIGSDTDTDDLEELNAHDLGCSARRLRRRVRGPGDRSSLTFEELPSFNIPEDEEPNGHDTFRSSPALLDGEIVPSLEALPFWVLDDPMIIDSDISRPSSRA